MKHTVQFSDLFAIPSEVASMPDDPSASRYVTDIEHRDIEAELGIWHVNDVPWHDAPLPRRFHRCQAQTRGPGVRRCACGAIAQTFGPWMEKNSRRRSR